MPLPRTKSELLERLDAAHRKLADAFSTIDDSIARDVHGDLRSPAFWAAYQIGWGRALLAWDEADRIGRAPEMPAPGFKWNALGALAEHFDAERRGSSFEALRRGFDEVVRDIRSFIERRREEEIFEVGRVGWAGPKWPVVKWVQVNTIAPYLSARTKILKWQKTPAPTAKRDAPARTKPTAASTKKSAAKKAATKKTAARKPASRSAK